MSSNKVAWPSGLRRWFKAPVSSGAWVRIPPLPNLLTESSGIFSKKYVRGHTDLNHGPIGLQPIALPLSYIPKLLNWYFCAWVLCVKDMKILLIHMVHWTCQITWSVGGIMVSIAAFQAVDPGSIPGRRRFCNQWKFSWSADNKIYLL